MIGFGKPVMGLDEVQGIDKEIETAKSGLKDCFGFQEDQISVYKDSEEELPDFQVLESL